MKTGKRMICTILSVTMIGTLLTGCSQVNNLMEKLRTIWIPIKRFQKIRNAI